MSLQAINVHYKSASSSCMFNYVVIVVSRSSYGSLKCDQWNAESANVHSWGQQLQLIPYHTLYVTCLGVTLIRYPQAHVHAHNTTVHKHTKPCCITDCNQVG